MKKPANAGFFLLENSLNVLAEHVKVSAVILVVRITAWPSGGQHSRWRAFKLCTNTSRQGIAIIHLRVQGLGNLGGQASRADYRSREAKAATLHTNDAASRVQGLS